MENPGFDDCACLLLVQQVPVLGQHHADVGRGQGCHPLRLMSEDASLVSMAAHQGSIQVLVADHSIGGLQM